MINTNLKHKTSCINITYFIYADYNEYIQMEMQPGAEVGEQPLPTRPPRDTNVNVNEQPKPQKKVKKDKEPYAVRHAQCENRDPTGMNHALKVNILCFHTG